MQLPSQYCIIFSPHRRELEIPGWGVLKANLLEEKYEAEFPFTHSCAYLMHKNLKGRSLFHTSASQQCMEACSFYKLHDNLSA